ncbi:MAG: putative baseplate assembly protein [Desulfobacteraceae bacterium]|nr:putative baseplate assembly protein [Desulfobacteraceae bacterium]
MSKFTTNKVICGCCEGTAKLTPLITANRPGLDALAYRIGTHATFLETMKASLAFTCLPDKDKCEKNSGPYLGNLLTTRSNDDPAIAMLDAWATVADVLTFYQERIANEGYLGTATERLSVLELARLVSYKLRPGVAATVYLAFTLEVGYKVEIPAGTRAQSIPEPGEKMESFETSDPLFARAEWNSIKPRLSWPQYISSHNIVSDIHTINIDGITNNLKPNDPMVFVFGKGTDEQKLRFAQKIEIDTMASRTAVFLQPEDSTLLAETYKTNLINCLSEIINEAPDGMKSSRIIEILDDLKGKAEKSLYITEIQEEIEATLCLLKGAHHTLSSRSTSLTEWLDSAIKTLNSNLQETHNYTRLTLEKETNVQMTTNLSSLIEKLEVLPSAQPANALHLTRKLSDVYGSKTDITPRLITAFKPWLQDTLYKSWEKAIVTDPAELQSVETLRVKAALFGHNAPLEPVYNDKGSIDHYEEWGLNGSTVVGVDLISTRLNGNTIIEALKAGSLNVIDARITVKQAGVFQSSQVSLQEEEEEEITVQMTGLTVSIKSELKNDSIYKITFVFVFDFSNIQRTVQLETVNLYGDQPGIAVVLDSEDERLVYLDQTVQYSVNGHKVSAALGNHFSISDESLLPVPEEQRNVLCLDAQYPQITPESWVVVERPGPEDPDEIERRVYLVSDVKTVSKAAYGLTGKVTQLTLNNDWLYDTDLDLSIIRKTNVYAQSEALTLVNEPICEDVAGNCIELDGLYDELDAGRWVIVFGERTDIPATKGVMANERVMIAGVTHDVQKVENDTNRPKDTTHTTVQLAKKGLAYTYKRDTVKIYGNVVKATHGETCQEILGSGDGSRTLQSFELKQAPLTFLAAPTADGAESTLAARINDVEWYEADNLFSLGPNDRRFITQTDNEAKISLFFGDGMHGVRLPTGPENVKAVYRHAIGKPGNVTAEQISLLASKPLGVKEVINPLRASGGADAESRDQARSNAPLAVMALDRLVSVRDYADFARTFAGIGKASAARLSDGRREVIHVTVAGAEDIPIDLGSDLYRNLCRALHRYGDPHLPILVSVRELVLLFISAKVHLLPDYEWESVEPNVREVLLDTFSFERRQLGQDVPLSGVISTAQKVKGVDYVDVDILHRVPETVTLEQLEDLASTLEVGQPQVRIRVAMDRIVKENNQDVIKPSQIAYISPNIPDTLLLMELMT